MKINLSSPDVTEAEIQAVCDVLRTPNLSLGPKVPEFEHAFCDYIGKKHALAVNSGTSALFISLVALGIGPGDEVITTPFTFIATSNSIMMVGAKPVFVDIDPVNYNIDPEKIEAAITDKTKAIMPVEVFGNPANFDKICEIADRHNLVVIEDSCEALGSCLNGKKAGTFGKVSFFAFYPNKQMTTGEGGILLTDDEEVVEHCSALRNQGRGRNTGWLGHQVLGYNFRLSDINCAMGIVQLSRIEEFKAKRKQVAKWYQEELANEANLIVPEEGPGVDMNWFVFVVRLTDQFTTQQRDAVLTYMCEAGIGCSNYFVPVHLQPFMREKFGFKQGDFPVTEHIGERTIALPFYNNLSQEQVKIVRDELKAAISKI